MSGKHHEGQSHRESLSRRLRTQQRFMYAIHETRESAPGARTKPSNIIPRTKVLQNSTTALCHQPSQHRDESKAPARKRSATALANWRTHALRRPRSERSTRKKGRWGRPPAICTFMIVFIIRIVRIHASMQALTLTLTLTYQSFVLNVHGQDHHFACTPGAPRNCQHLRRPQAARAQTDSPIMSTIRGEVYHTNSLGATHGGQRPLRSSSSVLSCPCTSGRQQRHAQAWQAHNPGVAYELQTRGSATQISNIHREKEHQVPRGCQKRRKKRQQHHRQQAISLQRVRVKNESRVTSERARERVAAPSGRKTLRRVACAKKTRTCTRACAPRSKKFGRCRRPCATSAS